MSTFPGVYYEWGQIRWFKNQDNALKLQQHQTMVTVPSAGEMPIFRHEWVDIPTECEV